MVHDLDGMTHKNRIPIDYQHNPNEIVGYVNKFNTDTGNLELKGALTPSENEQPKRTQEILDKSREGVPYEASIFFGRDFEAKQIPEGEEVTVNNRQFTGPLTVITKWTLRGVAVTPYGYDAGTNTQFSSDDVVQFTLTSKEDEMSDTKLSTAEAEVKDVIDDVADAVVDAETDNAETPEKDVVEAAPVENEPETALSAPTGKDFMDAFGRVQGALYFADGMSMEQATAKELERLQKENAELREKAHKFSSADDMDDAVSMSDSPENGNQPNVWNEVPGIDDLESKKDTRKPSI